MENYPIIITKYADLFANCFVCVSEYRQTVTSEGADNIQEDNLKGSYVF